ncbi:HK97 family phage prohead protease [Megasphaera sp. UBA4382]|uniref:HK97 family phage prohead protease n=1 Tax=Megasphaera sp. UBA4382 TaxID=1946850 RepID=UPI0025C4DF12|nr:HK97 family phage prohead protease [Megasphaera sp. UBA4382]
MANPKIDELKKKAFEWRWFGIENLRAEIRSGGDGEPGERIIDGHAAVYNRQTDIGDWFHEIIEPGAFDGCDLTDVPFIVNHDSRKIPLARSRNNNGNSTLTLTIDNVGLAFTASVDTENNPEARQLYSAIQRGDIDGMSYCFRIQEDRWTDLDQDMPTRHILKISKVFEISAVTFPAYKDTDINARSEQMVLESAREALESARAKAGLDSRANESLDSELRDAYKLKNRILAGGYTHGF